MVMLTAGCKKGNNEPTDGFNPEGYIIIGKMRDVVAVDGGLAKPYIMVFGADNQMELVTTYGRSVRRWSVQDDKLLVENAGYFTILDGIITGHVPAGLNIVTAELHRPSDNNLLAGREFTGSMYNASGEAASQEVRYGFGDEPGLTLALWHIIRLTTPTGIEYAVPVEIFRNDYTLVADRAAVHAGTGMLQALLLDGRLEIFYTQGNEAQYGSLTPRN